MHKRERKERKKHAGRIQFPSCEKEERRHSKRVKKEKEREEEDFPFLYIYYFSLTNSFFKDFNF